ncbi:Bcr/CflA family multidrug efflux MFS transporter [Marinobacter nanhaiticus D15-8W]|uniref:Bcr/CflA family efflux transporter n=1 Tax=Marinobacter nanhaiticus D15-8W TaxID=626887 RepID=N6X2T6_9GAMM|nr:multidrug effflux MFS transporter [Marinobacter nanhaiticus]ENO15398.1 MFS transporter [Marinobacter nanhaiticus D15-8W]BES73755.1 Bcr/CflA family multidrug efflux MFS transporter [Marinobacter nanhaiticus D15-8W]
MLQLASLSTTALLAAAVALGPLATDMYLPALPELGDAFAADTGQVQLTLSIYMIGFALAQLVCGPLADPFGRKPIMLGGLVLFALASVGCALAENIETLVYCRFLQALGGSAGPVLGRAAVRDIHNPQDAGRIMAILAAIMAIAPAIAPTVGGALLAGFGWPAIFLSLGGYALVVSAVIAFGLPEPLKPHYRQSLRPASLARNYWTVLCDRSFQGYALINALIFSGLFAFLSGASFVLIDFLGISPTAFGAYFSVMVFGFMTGSFLAARMGRRLTPDQLLRVGLMVSVVGGLLMATLAWSEVFTKAAVILPQAVFMIGVGMVLPQTMAGALAPFPHMAGSASAMFGFIQMASAAGAGVLVGHLHNGTSQVMATIIASCALAAGIAYLLRTARHTAPGFGAAASHG